MMKMFAVLAVIVLMVVGCDRMGINTGDNVSNSINTVITMVNGEGQEVVTHVLAQDGTAWVDVHVASPVLLMEREVEEVNGEYLYTP